MSAALAQPRPWPRRRWWGLVGLVFVVQLSLILWLSDRAPIRTRPPAAAPALLLAGNSSAEVLALKDPTLFALPHRQGFSGPAWLRIPTQKFPVFEWTEEPQFLSLPTRHLGEDFRRLTETNELYSLETSPRPQPELMLPELPRAAISPAQSTLRIEGELASWRLVAPPALPSWEHTDLLTNSIVQAVIDAEGKPVSVTLLTRSGLKAADDLALELAREMRFNPPGSSGVEGSRRPETRLTWGKLIFEWRTLPLPNAEDVEAEADL